MRNRYKRDNKRFANNEEDPRYNWFLSVINSIFPYILGGVRAVKPYWESFTRSIKSPIHYVIDYHSKFFGLLVELPCSKPVFYGVYISTQSWYLTPKKILPKIRKLRKNIRRLIVPNCDSYIAIVARRFTEPARIVASCNGIPMRTPEAFARDVRRYFAMRYSSIVVALRGKRIFGEMVFLVAMLQEITKRFFGRVTEVFPDLTMLERYAETGFVIPTDLGPPIPDIDIGGLNG